MIYKLFNHINYLSTITWLIVKVISVLTWWDCAAVERNYLCPGLCSCVCVCAHQHVHESLACGRSPESLWGNKSFCFKQRSYDGDSQDDTGVSQPCLSARSLCAAAEFHAFTSQWGEGETCWSRTAQNGTELRQPKKERAQKSVSVRPRAIPSF